MQETSALQLVMDTFPSIDNELYEYISGIFVSSQDDFESGEDIYEAVGEIFLNVADHKSTQDIRDLCDEIMCLLNPDSATTKDGKANGEKALKSPIRLGAPTDSESRRNFDDIESIWLHKNYDLLKVDEKRLQKAEQQILKKSDRKDLKLNSTQNKYKSTEASASQVINKRVAKSEASGTNNTKDIRIENFDISFGENVLIKSGNLLLSYGRRYGMVGRNGLGKSTLLKMISSGQLVIPSHISVLHVEQEVIGDSTIALDSVLESDEKRHRLLEEEKSINAKLQNEDSMNDSSLRLASIYSELELIEADSAPARASVILSGLGFTREMQNAPTISFSGGWRMRLALARALFCKPDLLLLDEPTNMLDMQAIIWLEKYLTNSWSSTLLVVSHDRNFLDSVPTDILHLHSHRLDSYRGNYNEFMRTMGERQRSQMREFEAQMEYRRHAQEFIDKFRFNAKRASLVQSRIKALQRLPELQPVEREAEVILKFPEVSKLSPPILVLSQVSFSYDGNKKNEIFSEVDISANMESRICIVGENGAGKTTLLKLLMDSLTPTRGNRTAHRNLKFGYFSQHHVDQLDLSVCPIELMQQQFPGRKTEEYRRMLGCFGISGDLALQQICSLSGGQKSRVAFAILCSHCPNFLILDEPTNHLDIQTIEALGNALVKYKGGVILVSHDERLIRMVCQELWVCSKGRVYSLPGGFDEYRKIVESELIL